MGQDFRRRRRFSGLDPLARTPEQVALHKRARMESLAQWLGILITVASAVAIAALLYNSHQPANLLTFALVFIAPLPIGYLAYRLLHRRATA
jgi:hypothetical protein